LKIDAILPQPIPIKEGLTSGPADEKDSFGHLLNQSLKDLNASQVKADDAIKQFLTGNNDDLHNVVIGLEEAKFNMQLTVQIRNKLLEAYKEMMRMQV